jgi:hypothetical protein
MAKDYALNKFFKYLLNRFFLYKLDFLLNQLLDYNLYLTHYLLSNNV